LHINAIAIRFGFRFIEQHCSHCQQGKRRKRRKRRWQQERKK